MWLKGSQGRGISRRIAAGAAAVTAVAGIGLGAPAADAATGPSWSSVGRTGVSGTVTAVASVQYGPGKTGEWAFVTTAYETNFKGYPSVYSRTNNESWGLATLPGSAPGEVFVAATAINNKDVLAFSNTPGGTGREWQFNGSAWKVVKTFSGPIGGASVTGASNVWVFGRATGSSRLGVYHFNGKTWTRAASTLSGGQALTESAAWAYTGSTVARFDGKTWTPTSLASLIPGSTPHIADVYDTDNAVYVVGQSQSGLVILVYNGKTWAKIGQLAGATAVVNQISGDGDGGIWFPVVNGARQGAAEVLHYTRGTGKLTVTSLPGSVLAITRVDLSFELAGGSVPRGKASPATYTELEYYN